LRAAHHVTAHVSGEMAWQLGSSICVADLPTSPALALQLQRKIGRAKSTQLWVSQ